ncbi:MAG: cytidine deaminase [Saprospiraceae bacterium]|nr:cytidine deaminase [Saprospiraceae bacterium]
MNAKKRKERFETTYEVLTDIDQLLPEDRELLQRAGNALGLAYAPYSGFSVSAAIRLADGQILTGTNQENAAYGLCICAEQNVLSTAGSSHKDHSVVAMAITARSSVKKIDHPISPCGACRQSISEHEDRHDRPIRLILRGEEGEIYLFQSIKDLLPLSFSGKDLKQL